MLNSTTLELEKLIKSAIGELSSRGGPSMNPSGAPFGRQNALKRLEAARDDLRHIRAILDPVPELQPLPYPEPAEPKKNPKTKVPKRQED